MSIFDRLMSTLKGDDGAVATAPDKARSSDAGEAGSRRFMGRDGAEDSPNAASAAPVEKGLDAGREIWLHVQPATQHLLLVPELGVAAGEDLTPKMHADLRRAGMCEEVAYHAGYDQYWKMPTQEAILRTPSLFEIPTPPLNRIKLETRLVKQGEPRGFWIRVRIRPDSELHQDPAHMV